MKSIKKYNLNLESVMSHSVLFKMVLRSRHCKDSIAGPGGKGGQKSSGEAKGETRSPGGDKREETVIVGDPSKKTETRSVSRRRTKPRARQIEDHKKNFSQKIPVPEGSWNYIPCPRKDSLRGKSL